MGRTFLFYPMGNEIKGTNKPRYARVCLEWDRKSKTNYVWHGGFGLYSSGGTETISYPTKMKDVEVKGTICQIRDYGFVLAHLHRNLSKVSLEVGLAGIADSYYTKRKFIDNYQGVRRIFDLNKLLVKNLSRGIQLFFAQHKAHHNLSWGDGIDYCFDEFNGFDDIKEADKETLIELFEDFYIPIMKIPFIRKKIKKSK